MIDRIVGANIATLRRQWGIAAVDLARQCSISVEQITAFESGETRPQAGQLLKIAEVLNVALDQLFSGAPGMHPLTSDIFALGKLA